MSKKNEFLYPAGFSDDALRFIDEQFQSFRASGELPTVRNKHEAYGIMAEKSVIVASGASSVKRALSGVRWSRFNSCSGETLIRQILPAGSPVRENDLKRQQ